MDSCAEKHNCFFIELPGFGKSSRPEFSKNFDVNEAAMNYFIDQWRIKVLNDENAQINLVGHSMGCYVIGSYALKYFLK